MPEAKASLESQLGNSPCLCEDTEEMFWLRESDDYESRVRLGNLLSGQYRFREAVDAYRSAEAIRADDPMLYIRLGGACLTLRRFDEAKQAYEKSRSLGAKEAAVSYPMGVRHYLLGEYPAASDSFVKGFPCGDEMKIALVYWNALCCMRGELPDRWLGTCRGEMQVGHHTAYLTAVEVFLGKKDAVEAAECAMRDKNDLNAVVALYGIAVYLEHCRKTEEAGRAIDSLLERRSVWPCIPYLAAWNDRNRHP